MFLFNEIKIFYLINMLNKKNKKNKNILFNKYVK